MSHTHNEKPSIGNYISSFHRIGTSYLAHQFDEYDIGFGQYQFLIQLYLEDGLSHEELTQRVFVDKANTTRAVTKLSDNGYVVIKKDEQDKRKYRIYLTEYAKSIQDDIWKIASQWENQLLGCLEESEVATLSEILTKIAQHNKWMNNK